MCRIRYFRSRTAAIHRRARASSRAPGTALGWSGCLGALTNNGVGIAGMSWGPWILPVRALGKCGGYDSDIIAGIEWAAGMPVTAAESRELLDGDRSRQSVSGRYHQLEPRRQRHVPERLSGRSDGGDSIGGAGGRIRGQRRYTAGQLAPVSTPANCSCLVPGVIAVAGLRNVGTKVGYSSFGAEVSISAPAGNCVNNGLPCLRAIDTTTNLGTTVPAANGYTNEMNPNLGTSFSAPIVSGNRRADALGQR